MEPYDPPIGQTLGEAHAAKLDAETRSRPLERWSWRRWVMSVVNYLVVFAMGLGVLWWMDVRRKDDPDTGVVPGLGAMVVEAVD